MRWFAPVFTAAIGLSLAACSPAEAPTVDNAATPPPTDSPASPEAAVPEADPSAGTMVIHYDCEGTPVDATFDGLGQVSVSIQGAHHVLRTEDGAAGTKYVDETGVVLWQRGGTGALLTRPDRPDRICTGAPATA